MEEMIFLKRKRSKNGSFLANGKIAFRFDTIKGRFVLFEKLTKQLNLSNGDAVMFAISRKDNCLYIIKEESCEDNYIVKQAGGKRSYSRFTCKDLANDIAKYLNLPNNKTDFFFEIGESIDNKLKLIPYIKQEIK